jgi:hypothetical protein
MGREYQRESLVLGSLDVFGDVLFADDFEASTLLWTGSGDGADFTVARATGAAYMGANGLSIATRTTAPAQGDIATATVHLPQTLRRKVTAMVHFRNISDALVKYVTLGFTGARADYAFNLGVRYDAALAKMQYQASGAGWSDVPLGGFDGSPDAFHRLMVVWDWSLMQYLKLVIDERYLAMTGVAFDVTANGGDLELQAYLQVTTAGAAVATSYFDNYAVLEGDHVRLGTTSE